MDASCVCVIGGGGGIGSGGGEVGKESVPLLLCIGISWYLALNR